MERWRNGNGLQFCAVAQGVEQIANPAVGDDLPDGESQIRLLDPRCKGETQCVLGVEFTGAFAFQQNSRHTLLGVGSKTEELIQHKCLRCVLRETSQLALR